MNPTITIEQLKNGFLVEIRYVEGVTIVNEKRIETRLDRVLKQVEKLFKEK